MRRRCGRRGGRRAAAAGPAAAPWRLELELEPWARGGRGVVCGCGGGWGGGGALWPLGAGAGGGGGVLEKVHSDFRKQGGGVGAGGKWL